MPMTPRLAALAVIAVTALVACSNKVAERSPPSPPVKVAGVSLPPPAEAAPRVSGKAEPSGGARGATPIIQPGGAVDYVPRAKTTVLPTGDISLDYVDTDIREIVRAVLGDLLQLNYSIDPGVQGRATIQTKRPLARDALLPTLQSLLDQNGLSLVYQNGIFRIAPAAGVGVVPPVGVDEPGSGSQVVPLRFASAKQLAAMLEPYVADGGRIVADPLRNVLIITGSAATRQSLADLVRTFDVDAVAGRSYGLFPIKSGDVQKAATDLQRIFEAESGGSLAGVVRIIPIDRVNAVLMITQQQAYLDRARVLLGQFERIGSATRRNLYVYFVQNSQASDLLPILQKSFNAGGGAAPKDSSAPPGNVPPTAEATQVSGFNNHQQGQSGATGQAMSAAPAAGGAAAPQAATEAPSSDTGAPDTGSGSATEPGAATDRLLIIADKRRNALVIRGTEDEYREIEAAIRKLDVLPLQVLVEATVAEVTLNDNLRYGTQFFLSNGGTSALLTQALSATPTPIGAANATTFAGSLAGEFPGFGIIKVTGATQFALQALKEVTDVRVISSPHLLILDNERARLQVGADVPIITQQATSVATADAPIVNSVSYRETGVILTVTPRVNSSGLITLDIQQEVSDVVPTTTTTISPTFNERKVQSRIVIQDGDTIALAGLISDTHSKSGSGIPFLKDIPVLGFLFGEKQDNDSRTELIVLITPKIVHDQRDARAITEELRRKLSSPKTTVDDHAAPTGLGY
jgi:general secretion pathway protein D